MEGLNIERFCDGDSKAELLVELDELRRRVSEMSSMEERCRKAEAALEAIEERGRLWRECAPMGVCAVDGQGRITTVNRKMREMLCLPPTPCDDHVSGSATPGILEYDIGNMVRDCLEKRETVVFERSQRGSDGECERLRYHLSPVSDADGTAIGAIAFGEDVTELSRTEQALRDSEKRYRLLFESAPIAMMERDASELKAYIEELRASGVTDFREYVARNSRDVGRCMSMIKTLSCNAAFLELMEVSHEVAFRNGFGMALFEDAEELAREVVLMMAEGGTTNEKERTFTTLKGNRKNVLAKTMVVSGHEDTFARIVVALVDISRRKQAEERLRISEQRFRDQAMRDDLTGLYNRRYLYRSLDALIASSDADGSQLSVIFMDIDYFKDVVDTYGHLNGSQVIREVAVTIGNCLENPAYAVAYAGDEFVVVLPGFDSAPATQKALEIRYLMKQAVYLRDQGAAVRLRASFGVATFPDHAQDMSGLLAAADQALFAVKQSVKNSVMLYGRSSRPL
jgi:diguanylate cyclase (GGDEF)-like protein/PAS domain S-box-containing protein